MAAKSTIYDVVMRSGRRLHDPAFSLLVLPVTVPISPRIVVSRKVTKLATERNRIKRRLRRIFAALPATSRLGIILIAKAPILALDYAGLTRAVSSPLKRLA